VSSYRKSSLVKLSDTKTKDGVDIRDDDDDGALSPIMINMSSKGDDGHRKPEMLPIGTAVALFTHEADEDDELDFPEGATIEVLEMRGEWFLGRLDGRVGDCPGNYVRFNE
jgi:hypothetical protein